MLSLLIKPILVLFLIVLNVTAQEQDVDLLKQVQLCSSPRSPVSARFASLGGALPAIKKDIGSLNANPISIANVTALQSSFTSSQLICDRRSLNFHIARPLEPKLFFTSLSVGFFYQEDVFSDKTIVKDLRNQYVAGVASSFGLPFTNEFIESAHAGISMKALLQETTSTSTSEGRLLPILDANLAVRLKSDFKIPFIMLPSYVDVGVGFSNFSFADSAAQTPDTTNLADNAGTDPAPTTPTIEDPWLYHEVLPAVSFGLYAPLFFEGYYQSIFFQSYGEVTEMGLGAEWVLNSKLTLRGSLIMDTSVSSEPALSATTSSINYKDSSRIGVGFGYNFERIPGIDFFPSKGRFDYGFSFLTDGTDRQFRFGLSLLGKAQDAQPVILSPENQDLVTQQAISVSGTASKNAQVTLYKNRIQAREVQADKDGKWVVDNVRLVEGENELYVRSISGRNEISTPSKNVIVRKDTKKPDVRFNVLENKTDVDLVITGKEALGNVAYQGEEGWIDIEKLSDLKFKLNLPIETSFESILGRELLFKISDLAQNVQYLSLSPLVIKFSQPNDKSILFNKNILVLGQVSPLVKSLIINGEYLSFSNNRGFVHSMVLKTGKNMISANIILKDNESVRTNTRVLVVQRFDDIGPNNENRQIIENLGTLGFVKPKQANNFVPNDSMTRLDVALWMQAFLNLPLNPIKQDVLLDVTKDNRYASEIKAVLDEGVLIPRIDGTFGANQVVTVTDAYQLFRNLGLISANQMLISNNPITRLEFALIFTETQRYLNLANNLYNWETGF